MNDATLYNSTLHRTAVLTAAATFPLIFMGGLVTSHGAGMSVPDWPNTYGYNMFLFPPRLWVGGILYEHTHRLMGTVVGMLSILLTLHVWGAGRYPTRRRMLRIMAAVIIGGAAIVLATGPVRSIRGAVAVCMVGLAGLLLIASFVHSFEPRRWVRWLATASLGAVIFQGLLGGLRVLHVDIDLAIVHACFAQAFFCFATLTAIVTSRWWINAPNLSEDSTAPAGRRLAALAAACLFAIYAQLIVGAVMRHYHAGLAIPDLPFAYGKLLPPTDQNALKQANLARAWEAGLTPVTMLQVWVHFGHRVGAVIVSLLSAVLIGVAARRHRALRTPAVLIAILIVAQVTLGVLTVVYRKPADIASAHVAVGALVLVTTFVLFIRAARLYMRRSAALVCDTGAPPVPATQLSAAVTAN